MASGHARPNPEILSFLQSLVTNGTEHTQQPERTDSDKENEAGLVSIAEEESTSSSGNNRAQLPVEMKQDPVPGLGGRDTNNNNNNNNNIANGDDTKMWDDFYNEEDFKPNKNKNGDIRDGTDRAESEGQLSNVKEEEEEGLSQPQTAGDDNEDNNNDQQEDVREGSSERTAGTKKKKKRLFRRTLRPPSASSAPTVSGGSHPNLGSHQNEQDLPSSQLETMSETSGRGRRRLCRRKQVARPRCAGPAPEGDCLEQKYQELEQLMVKPLGELPIGHTQISRQQLISSQGMAQQYGLAAHGLDTLPPAGGATVVQNGQPRQAFVELGQENSENGYSTIRTVQMINRTVTVSRPRSTRQQRRSPARRLPRRPLSAGQAREDNSSPDTGQRKKCEADSTVKRGSRRKGSGDRSNNDSVQGSARSENDDGSKTDATSDGEGKGRSGSRSPGRTLQLTDMHLKNSSNPALRQWLLRKNKEHRKHKAEERQKKREERSKKQELQRQKDEILEKSDVKVKEWMDKKKKEARRRAREDRKKLRGERAQLLDQQQQNTQTHHDKKVFIPVIRPETVQGERDGGTSQQLDVSTLDSASPQPPPSKFVYKRPVSGRVRLMKLQQNRKENAKMTELQKREEEKRLADEKARKMRMSYDQWLLRKREEDYAKRQDVARQKALAKSDPELERIVPEMARRRIENMKFGKKRIDTGIRKINDEVNKSFGGADFRSDDVAVAGVTSVQSSYNLEVSGSQKSLGLRPSSAKPASTQGILNPRISKSPRRPKSANPQTHAHMQADSAKKDFRLPFPPERGVPKYVDSKQKKLFSPHMTHSDNLSTPEAELSQDTQNNDSLATSTTVHESEEFLPQSQEATEKANSESEKNPNGNELQQHIEENVENEPILNEEEGKKSFFVTDGNLQATANEVVISQESLNNGVEDDTQASEDQGLDKEQEASPESSANDPALNAERESQDVEVNGHDTENIADTEEKAVEEETEDLPQKEDEDALSAKEADNNCDQDEAIELEGEEEKNENPEEEENDSVMSDSKFFEKHVSFQEEAEVFEAAQQDELAEDYYDDDDDDDYDEAEDERGGSFFNDSPRDDEQF